MNKKKHPKRQNQFMGEEIKKEFEEERLRIRDIEGKKRISVIQLESDKDEWIINLEANKQKYLTNGPFIISELDYLQN